MNNFTSFFALSRLVGYLIRVRGGALHALKEGCKIRFEVSAKPNMTRSDEALENLNASVPPCAGMIISCCRELISSLVTSDRSIDYSGLMTLHHCRLSGALNVFEPSDID